MIIQQDFQQLITGHGTKDCDMKELLDKSRAISSRWNDGIVNNKERVNFSLDKDLMLTYKPEGGQKRKTDISQFAFAQLCGRMGVPANYIKKCFVSNKEELALQNFKAWAAETESNMLFRESNGVVRAVLSDKYAPFDSYRVLRALKYSADLERWKLTQVHLSEDRLVARFVDFTPLPVNDGSHLYLGFNVSSSDVGNGALSITMMLYRSVCQNGLLISSMGGTLYRQTHVGEKMTESKLATFNQIFFGIDASAKAVLDTIGKCRNRILKDYEMEVYLERARRELKLSEKSMEKMNSLLGRYEQSQWGLINSVTELAQDFTLDTRLDMESWAGNFFAKSI